MTDDLIQRLREWQRRGPSPQEIQNNPFLFGTAADEIERLRGALAQSVSTVGRLLDERAALKSRLDAAPVAIMDTRDTLGICAPTEECFPALIALRGKRVRLVVEEDE